MHNDHPVVVWTATEPPPRGCVPVVEGNAIVWRKKSRVRAVAFIVGVGLYAVAINILALPGVRYEAAVRGLIVLTAITFIIALAALLKK